MLKSLLSSSALTTAIAVVGLALSIYNFSYTLWCNRTCYHIQDTQIFQVESGGKLRTVLALRISNLSNRPLIISRITAVGAAEPVELGLYRQVIYKRVEPDRIAKSNWASDLLPVKIEGRGCANLLVMSNNGVHVKDPTPSREY